MWLIQIFRFIIISVIAVVITGAFAAFMAGLQGKKSSRGRFCPKCRGTGWIAVDATTQRACGCGVLPPETRGRILDPPNK